MQIGLDDNKNILIQPVNKEKVFESISIHKKNNRFMKHNNKLDELFPPKHQPIRSEKEALVASQQYASIEKIRKQNKWHTYKK